MKCTLRFFRRGSSALRGVEGVWGQMDKCLVKSRVSLGGIRVNGVPYAVFTAVSLLRNEKLGVV